MGFLSKSSEEEWNIPSSEISDNRSVGIGLNEAMKIVGPRKKRSSSSSLRKVVQDPVGALHSSMSLESTTKCHKTWYKRESDNSIMSSRSSSSSSSLSPSWMSVIFILVWTTAVSIPVSQCATTVSSGEDGNRLQEGIHHHSEHCNHLYPKPHEVRRFYICPISQ